MGNLGNLAKRGTGNLKANRCNLGNLGNLAKKVARGICGCNLGNLGNLTKRWHGESKNVTGKRIHGEYGEHKNVCIGNIVLEGKLTIPTWSGGLAKY